MSKPLTPVLVCLLALCWAFGAGACERQQPQANGDDRTRHVGLAADWTDARILQNLKLMVDRADVTRKESGDTVTVRYAYFHKVVTIARSASSGVQVQAEEKGRAPLVWKLGKC